MVPMVSHVGTALLRMLADHRPTAGAHAATALVIHRYRRRLGPALLIVSTTGVRECPIRI
jgi:hypothetical protein